MTGTISTGEVIPLPTATRGRANAFSVVPVRAEDAVARDAPALNNVVPFVRPGANDNARHAPDVVLPTDLARLPVRSQLDRLRIASLVTLSLLAHGSLAALLFWHEPPPLASVGLETITVELVLGATAPAGATSTPGETDTQASPKPNKAQAEPDKTAQKATEQPQDVPVAEKETAPDVKVEQPAETPKAYETAAATEAQPAEAPPAVAMIETPNADSATAKPQGTAAPPQEFSMLPPPPEKPAEKKPERKPEATKAAPPKSVKDASPASERRRIAAPTREAPAKQAKASAPSSQANNVGVGRSSNDANYRGLVAAHLARYKRPIPDTRGTASVTFVIGGGGGVTSVRLAHASGVASIDAEVTAMVRRASPFPAPPGGRAQAFTVPVSFRVN